MLSDVFVNGQPQQPSRRPDNNALLVRLPARGTASASAVAPANDAPVSVRFVYSVSGESAGRSGLGAFGHLRAAPPVVEDTRTLQTEYSLYLPSGYRYVHLSSPMREIYTGWGWSWLRDLLDPFVPTLGPDQTQVACVEWQKPPPLPAASGGGFDSAAPKEGTPIVLRRLDRPAAVEISYRSLGYANTVEGLAFFVALGGGLALLGSSRGLRLTYFFLAGIGALVVAGAVAPRAGGFWTAIYLGVFVAALFWLAAGAFRWARRLSHRFARGRRLLWTKLHARVIRPSRQDPPPPSDPPPAAPSEPTASV